MIRPATNALASSVASIATTSSWWALVRGVRIPSEQARPNRNVLQTNTVDAMSPGTRPAGALRRDVRQALIRSGIFGRTGADVVSALIEHVRPVRFSPGHVVLPKVTPAVVCT